MVAEAISIYNNNNNDIGTEKFPYLKEGWSEPKSQPRPEPKPQSRPEPKPQPRPEPNKMTILTEHYENAAPRMDRLESMESIEVDCKTIYATEKVREVIRNHEEDIRAQVVPRTKCKIVVLGDSAVGKTTLVYRHRFTGNELVPFNATIGASFVSADIQTPTEDMTLQIWDTAGQERFRCMVPMYMRNASAAIVVYDVTNRHSFNCVERWIEELRHCCGMVDPVVVLIGNKADLEEKREVAVGEGVAKALTLNARFYEIGAHTPDAFKQVLEELTVDLVAAGYGCEFVKSCTSSPALTLTSPAPSERDIDELESEPRSRKCCALL